MYEQLQCALHHRTVVEQAKGVLDESGGMDVHQAYTRLRDHARAHHLRLSDVARDVARGTLSPTPLLIHNTVTDTR